MVIFNFILYFLLGIFGLYFNEVIILNEKFLLLGIFLGFVLFVKNFMEKEIEQYFLELKKELLNEIFIVEYWNEIKFSDNYLYLIIDLLRQKVFKRVFHAYLKGLNFLILFHYNFNIKRENLNIVHSFKNLVNDVYYFVMKKHLYIKLNFLYRSYYYIFYKFRTV